MGKSLQIRVSKSHVGLIEYTNNTLFVAIVNRFSIDFRAYFGIICVEGFHAG